MRLSNLFRSSSPTASIGTLLVTCALALLPQWQAVELALFDQFTVTSAAGKSALPITIIGIDEPSFAEMKQPWPWPRSLHGHLLDHLREAGVAVVAFDIIFAEPSADPSEDRAFATAIGRFGQVVLAADLVYSESAAARQWLRVDPLDEFLAAGAVAGIASVDLDQDSVFRRVPAFRDAFWKAVVERFSLMHPDFVAEPAAGSDLRVNYRGGPNSYTYIPYYQMLDPDRYLPPHWREFLKDNIVLVGRNSKSGLDIRMAQADFFATPFLRHGSEFTTGVELQATLVDNMISGDHRRELPVPWRYAAILLAVLFGHFAMHPWRPLRSGLLAATGILALLGGSYLLFSLSLLWLAAGAPVAALLLSYLAHGGVAYWLERRQRQQIKAAFSMYVAPEVVEEVIADPSRLRLGGERREITVMFTDLAGFTSIAEKMPAEEVAHMLNRHLTEMTAIIHHHRGTVDKFIGDAIMAFWGAPVADPEQSLRAVRAAVEMQQAMSSLRKEILDAGGPELNMRIGLHRGECIVGNMGSEQRFDYSAIGDTVNLASRLEGANKPYGTGILLSQAVADAVADNIGVRPVDVIRVKGKSQPIAVFTPCDDEQFRQRAASLEK